MVLGSNPPRVTDFTEGVRMDEETVLKTVGRKSFVGSIPSPSASCYGVEKSYFVSVKNV